MPAGHPEIQRLREELDQPGKGGLHLGATVALSNGQAAVIRAADEAGPGPPPAGGAQCCTATYSPFSLA